MREKVGQSAPKERSFTPSTAGALDDGTQRTQHPLERVFFTDKTAVGPLALEAQSSLICATELEP